MMNPRPRMTITEFRREVGLTSGRYLVVEGSTDRRFYSEWIKQKRRSGANNSLPFVLTIDQIEVPDGGLVIAGLEMGNRSRALFLAANFGEDADRVRVIADKDVGTHSQYGRSPILLWTDYPSLESYAFTPAVLASLNSLFLSERLPSGDSLVRDLAGILGKLYHIRASAGEIIANPSIEKGMGKGARGIKDFDVAATVPPKLRALLADFSPEPLEYCRYQVYGHDIARLLMVVFSNKIKNLCGIRSIEVLEDDLRAALLIDRSFEEETLFVTLERWLDGDKVSPGEPFGQESSHQR